MDFCLRPRTPLSAPNDLHARRGNKLARQAKVAWLCIGIDLMTGCGSGDSSPTPTGSNPQAVTKVTLVVSSDANDQLTAFYAALQGITLTNGNGKTVTLLSQPLGSEFIHVNGRVEPLVTVTVPEDIYTSATVTIGGSQFNCVTLGADGALVDSTFAYGYVPAPKVTVALPQPLNISGDSLGLTLRMMVSESATLSSCSAGATYAITPAFALTAFDIANATAGSASNSVFSIEGAVTSIDTTASTFEIARPTVLSEPATNLDVSIDAGTALQGVDGLASMAVGMFVDLDGAIQPDGSLHATRVAVPDPTAVDVRRGPILSVFNQSTPIVNFKPIEGQGPDGLIDSESYDIGNTSFRISGELTNLPLLPFAASFTATDMTPGQNISISSPAFVTCCGASYDAPATTITLLPQTVDGLILGTTTSGQFTVYSVQLSSADLFASLAVQPGQTTSLSQPNEMQVYVDGNTRLFNSMTVAVGGTFRFYGLVFNDQGILRMDCAQINDGVTLTAY